MISRLPVLVLLALLAFGPIRAAAESLFLELIETNTDTFAQDLADLSSLPYRAPFTFRNGILFIDQEVLDSPEMAGLPPGSFRQRLSGKDPEAHQIFLIHRVRHDGAGIINEGYLFQITDKLPLQIEPPEARTRRDPSFTVQYQGRGPEEYVQRLLPGETLVVDFDDLVETVLGLRFWSGGLEIQEVSGSGRVSLKYAGKRVMITPGKEALLSEEALPLKMAVWNSRGDRLEFGEIRFTTRLALVNHGFVETFGGGPGPEGETAQ